MEPANLVRARAKAMDLLARREHAARELVDKLARKGIDRDCAETAVAALAEDGLQSDVRYAESVVSARIQQGKGPLHLLHGLKKCGVDAAVAQAALDEAEADWFALAAHARHRRFGAKPAADAREHARQMRFLLQRGFTAEQAHAAVKGGDDMDTELDYS